MHLVFVYGSLKRGFGNHPVIEAESTRFLGSAYKTGAELYSLGSFPAMIYGEGDVWGELYEVDDATLSRLDRLEGHPTFYKREQMVVAMRNETVGCEGYIFQHGVDEDAYIESGEWEHGQVGRRIQRAGSI